MRATFSFSQLLWIIALTVFGLMMAIFLSFPLILGIAPGFFILIFFARLKAIPWQDIYASSLRGLYRNKDVAWLLVFIGILLPT